MVRVRVSVRVRARIRVRVRVRVSVRVSVRGDGIFPHTCMQGRVVRHAV